MSNYAPQGMTKQEYQREYYKKNRQMFLDAQLRLVYGITRNDYNMLLVAQNNMCAICGSPGCSNGKRRGKLYVDHVMIDEKPCVRGLLCHKCNCALGMLGDNEKGLAKALAYVQHAKPVI